MSQKDYDMNPRWYVVHTYSGYENKVKTDLEKTIKNRELEEYFFDIIVPMEEQIEIKDGKKKTNLKKVFPGYVLIKMIVTSICCSPPDRVPPVCLRRWARMGKRSNT